MIKTEIHYKSVYDRSGSIKKAVLSIFLLISSSPRLLLEVFVRREMGIRYFNLSQCIRLIVFLFLLPFLLPFTFGQQWFNILLANWGWYLFLIAFGKFSFDRAVECSRPYGYFDFNHYSISTGRRVRWMDNIKFMGRTLNDRTKDVYLEPILATVVGLLVLLLGQWMLALLLIICAGITSMSYMAAYEDGRNYLLDIIDDHLRNNGLANTLLNNEPTNSNFHFYGPKPTSDEIRKGFENLLRNDDGTDVL